MSGNIIKSLKKIDHRLFLALLFMTGAKLIMCISLDTMLVSNLNII